MDNADFADSTRDEASRLLDIVSRKVFPTRVGMVRVNAKHTPSPWKIVRDDDGCFEIADSNGILVTKTVARGGTVNRANASLIVLAPDLLECVKRAAELELANHGQTAHWNAYNQAIQKATKC